MTSVGSDVKGFAVGDHVRCSSLALLFTGQFASARPAEPRCNVSQIYLRSVPPPHITGGRRLPGGLVQDQEQVPASAPLIALCEACGTSHRAP